jgi:alkyl hydroperoxide reductase subunit AhpC
MEEETTATAERFEPLDVGDVVWILLSLELLTFWT